MPADLPQRPTAFVTLFEEMQLMFDSFRVTGERKLPAWKPDIDFLEDAEKFYVLVEVPGIPPDKIEVSSSERKLEIRGIRQPPSIHLGAYHHHVERHYGLFERKIMLPSSIDPVRVSTELKDGVLTIVLPKK